VLKKQKGVELRNKMERIVRKMILDIISLLSWLLNMLCREFWGIFTFFSVLLLSVKYSSLRTHVSPTVRCWNVCRCCDIFEQLVQWADFWLAPTVNHFRWNLSRLNLKVGISNLYIHHHIRSIYITGLLNLYIHWTSSPANRSIPERNDLLVS
jgi:hypothetical protein